MHLVTLSMSASCGRSKLNLARALCDGVLGEERHLLARGHGGGRGGGVLLLLALRFLTTGSASVVRPVLCGHETDSPTV